MAEEGQEILQSLEESESSEKTLLMDMELEPISESPVAGHSVDGSGENGGTKRGREDGEEEGHDEGSKKQKVERSLEEKRLEKLEEKKEEENLKEGGEETKKLGPKAFDSSVEMFEYFMRLLHSWSPNLDINKYEHMALLDLIKKGHPEPDRKVGVGIQTFQVRIHPAWKSRCFFLVRVDGTSDDFSFRKCVDGIIPLPDNMKAQSVSNGGNKHQKGGGRGGQGSKGGGRGGFGRGRRGRR